MLLALAAVGAPAPGKPDFTAFVGACWMANFTSTMSDRHCFSSVLGGSHVRDAHEVSENGRVVYAGETTYSLDGDAVVFTYLNSLGGVGRGQVRQDRSLLHFTGTMRGSPDKPVQLIDTEWRVVDQDHYEVRSLVKSPSTAGNQVLRFTRVTSTTP